MRFHHPFPRKTFTDARLRRWVLLPLLAIFIINARADDAFGPAHTGGIDSGGGGNQSTVYLNHGSIGSPIFTGPSTGGEKTSSPGLIIVLFAESDPAGPDDAYAAWAASFDLSGDDADPGADPDGDGWTNFQEFAFGTNPTVPTSTLIEFERDGANFVITFLAREDGMTYEVETSTTLQAPWDPALDITVITPVDQSGVPEGYVRLQFSVPIEGTRFYRIKATVAGP